MKHPKIDQILTEWAYRVHNGMPNPNNPMHIVKLKESLEHLKIDEEVIDMNSILSVFKVVPIKPGIFVLISEDRYYGEETF